ncbi:hypothetical protein [Cryptosporangium phraense]|uniref:DUF4878 domain-containing protein n=1 Tax=Cryptosporangium phraense TaxID=2593070 RepID=A0A545AHI7_9ACTN|nr:hypothetical protein [Cryptosporangium phraense]TQS40787.1 hypothetical protein FL583_33030 [Cryptosporangium phraense]
MTWVPPSSGGYSQQPYVPPAYQPPPPVRSEREQKRERALRALPPPPTPPPGMGARPAFAPPVPRPTRTVLIVSLGLGATLLICCGGSVFGVGGLFYYGYNTLQKDAVATVDGYLGDLRDGRYQQAYARLCLSERQQRSLDDFTRDERATGQVTTYTVGDDIEVDQNSNWVITAQVAREGSSAGPERFPVNFDDANAARICPT